MICLHEHAWPVGLMACACSSSPQSRAATSPPSKRGRAARRRRFVEKLLGKAGTTFRTYRNALVILAADAAEAAALRERAKRSLALRAVQDHKALVR